MTMSECFYNPTNQCGGQFSGASPPPDWKEVECDCCSAKFWACPNCAPTEDCYPPSCPGCRIPPPIGSPLPAGEEDPFREVEALVKGAARHPQHTPPRRPTLLGHGVIDVGRLDGNAEEPGSTGASPDDPPDVNPPPQSPTPPPPANPASPTTPPPANDPE